VLNIYLRHENEYLRFDTNNSAVRIFNAILNNFSQVCSSRASTSESLEAAISVLDIDINQDWIQSLLKVIEKEEIHATMGKLSLKRNFIESLAEDEQEWRSKKLKTKVIKATVVAQPVMHKICKFNCCTRGCTSNNCRFEHVKGSRTLSKSEKDYIKNEIKKYNSLPHVTAAMELKEELCVLGS
jgi:hypothetical protein